MRLASLALLATGAVGALAQSPSQQIQAQQERALQERADEQRRAIIREQRENVDREHAEERLLQRRAAEEQERQAHAQPEEMGQVPELNREPPPVPPIVHQAQTGPDFSPSLVARAVGAGLLAGAAALLLGKMIQRRFLHG
jgi:hypothetical protein